MHILDRQVDGFPLIFSSWVHRGGDAAVSLFSPLLYSPCYFLKLWDGITHTRSFILPYHLLERWQSSRESGILIVHVWIQSEAAISRVRRCYLDKGLFQAEGMKCTGWLTPSRGLLRSWKRPEDKATPEAECRVQEWLVGQFARALKLAMGACWLQGCVGCAVTGSHTPKGSMLGLMLCFSIMKFINTFWARDPAFPSCTGSHKLHSQFCSSEI